MTGRSLVSVVIIFLDAEKYLEEAIENVFAQTYEDWELWLVDDGSTDASTDIARRYATQKPAQVYYLEHPGHSNRGKGASRNLGVRHARGDYVALLDADDIWLPHKLEEQVAFLDTHPEVGMLYGETLYWYSWIHQCSDSQDDFAPPLGIPPNTPIEPPKLLPLYLRGKAAVPCPSSVLIRRTVFLEVGGFDETFIEEYNIYEDQAFYAKVCINTPIVAVNKCWDLYRQHPESSMAVAMNAGQEIMARHFFLLWLQDYLKEATVQDTRIWHALQRELWRIAEPAWLPSSSQIQTVTRWAKKWLLNIEENTLPSAIQHRLWKRAHNSGI
jgi:glycosyltransferase involved in cell wall biosynthesis